MSTPEVEDKCRGVKRGKCHKQGPKTRNGFLNFLRDYRKKACGKSMVQIAKEGGRKWRSMKDCEKKKYNSMVSINYVLVDATYIS